MNSPSFSSKFENLNDKEYSQLVEGVTWITLLIAGADGKIDDSEITWAEKLANIRSYATPEKLNSFYKDVDLDFENRVKSYIPDLPEGRKKQTQFVSEKVAALNPILAKMDLQTASILYKSLISFAEHVAKAEGGFLRFFSVSASEKKLVGLPMLDPIEFIDEED